MSLYPNPMVLYPNSPSWSGPVFNNQPTDSKPPWKVHTVLSPTGKFLSKYKWSFTVSSNGTQNDATLTLAPNSIEEQEIMSSGGKLTLAVKYTDNAQLEILYVGLVGK